MEKVGLDIASAIFERIGQVQEVSQSGFLNAILLAIFTSLSFYRNSTKSKVIPVAVMRSVHSFFATIMVCEGSQFLIQGCNSIQPDILFMILGSEG